MMRPILTAIVFAFALFVAFVWFVVGDAWGHWRYELHCCDQRDCVAVTDDRIITETQAGFTLNDTNEFVARDSPKVRKPLDENYHVCRNPAGTLLCIYPKLQGM